MFSSYHGHVKQRQRGRQHRPLLEVLEDRCVPAALPPSDLVSWYRAEGNVNDWVGSNHGGLNGATIVPGMVGQSFSFDGDDDYVVIPDSPTLSPSSMTIEGWVFMQTFFDNRVIVSKYDSDNSDQGVSWKLHATGGGQLNFSVYEDFGAGVYRGAETANQVLTITGWHHVAASFDQPTQAIKIYVDGVEAASNLLAGSSNVNAIHDSRTPVRIGTYRASGALAGFWHGKIDELDIYSRALTAGEVQSIYNAGSEGKATLVVTTTSDVVDPNDGRLSLREAINASNGTIGVPDVIGFNIPANDPRHFYYRDNGAPGVALANVAITTAVTDSTIADIDPDYRHSWFSMQPGSALPQITDKVIIDGYTQPDASANTLATGNDAVLKIELDGSQAGFPGLQLAGANQSVVRGLVFSRWGTGIQLGQNGNAPTQGAVIEGNFIGIDPSGTLARPHPGGSDGISLQLSASGIHVGGTTPAARNVISGSTGQAISLFQSDGNFVQGNFIGTDRSGTAALGSSSDHNVTIHFADNNLIGGVEAGAGNVISAATLAGISLAGGSTGNRVQGNFIGTDATGTKPLGNGTHGMVFGGAPGNTVGGTAPGAGNVIAATKAGPGIGILAIGGANATTGTAIQGNFIGTDRTGTITDLGNKVRGIDIAWTGNSIGGSAWGAGNVIAFNTGAGVVISTSGASVPIRGNSIYANTGLGISLGNGVTPTQNDGASDGDAGPNGLRDFPGITSVVTSGGSTTISGRLRSPALASYLIEFFASAAPDDTGHGEGQTFLGSTTVTILPLGPFDGSISVTRALPPGQKWVTATATDIDGNTSEFAQAVQEFIVQQDTSTNLVSTVNPSLSGQSIRFTASVAPSQGGGTPTGMVTFYDGANVLGTARAEAQPAIDVASLTVGTHNITAIYESDAYFFGSTSNTVVQVVNALPAQKFLIDAPPVTSAGAPFSVTVSAVDQLGNPTAGYVGTVHFSSSDGNALLPQDYAFTAADNGVHVFTGVELWTTGNQSLTVSDTVDQNLNAVAGVHVKPGIAGPIHHFQVLATASIRPDEPFKIAVTAMDASGNTVTGYTGTVHFASSDFNATLPGDYTFVANNQGTQSFNVQLHGIGTQSITVTHLANPAIAGTANVLVAPVGATTFVVTHVGDFSPGSLRQAILDANSHPGRDTVRFNIGRGMQTIHVDGGGFGPLPGVTEAAVLDATTQPGFRATPLIALNGAALPGGAGINLTGDDSMVRGFVIGKFSDTGIMVTGSNNVIVGNFVGTDATPLIRSNHRGVAVLGGSNNLIGGTTPGTRNVIVGNHVGVLVNGSATGTVVQGNWVGLDGAGRTLGNDYGVQIFHSSHNLVGGAALGARNVISGNRLYGVTIEGAGATNNRVQGNVIGTDFAGAAARANRVGVDIQGASDNVVGGTTPGTRNVISGNIDAGIRIQAANDNHVLGNFIGLDQRGMAALPNLAGIVVLGNATNNTIGGSLPAARNLIAGNTTGVSIVASGNHVMGNHVGLGLPSRLGERAIPNGTGIRIQSGAANIITGNVVSGNTGAGVLVGGTHTVVSGNRVGVGANFPYLVPNAIGILVRGSDNLIGGATLADRNVVGGNLGHGVLIDGTHDAAFPSWNGNANRLEGNWIGFDHDGAVATDHQTGTVRGSGGGSTTPAYRAAPNGQSGVAIRNATDNVIGGVTPEEANLVTGNRDHGILLENSANNQVLGNKVGRMWFLHPIQFDRQIANNLTNEDSGVRIVGGQANLVQGCIITNNGLAGVDIDGSQDNVVEGNFIGLYPSEELANNDAGLAANAVGVMVKGGSTGNVIGGVTPGAGNVISFNSTGNVLVTGAGTSRNRLEGNLIGSYADGASFFVGGTISTPPLDRLSSSQYGIEISGGASDNVIGGTDPRARNLISGNYTGVNIGANALRNRVLGNFIGTDLSGETGLFEGYGSSIINTVSWGNRHGLLVFGNDNFIGGEEAGAGNLISGNEHVGLSIAGDRNRVAGNFIGTDLTGTVVNGNRRAALVISGKNNVVGTHAADGFAAANVIAGNLQTGVTLTNTATNNVVAGNFIGTDSFGAATLPNGQDGILVEGANNVIGGLAPNVISGNTRDGIRIDGGTAQGNRVESNFIGTDATGVSALGNGVHGVRISGGRNNVIGGTAIGVDNVIAFNGGAGVCVSSGNGNGIRRNAVFTNNGAGIKLTGQGNLAQPAPVLAAAVFDVSAGSLAIAGGLSSTPRLNFTVEFFVNSPGDPEGRTYLGSTTVRTDARGRGLVTATFANVLLAAGDLITATATSSLDNTSGFSAATAVVTQ